MVETTLNRNAFEISDSWVDDMRYVKYATKASLAPSVAADILFGDSIRLDNFALGADSVQAGDAVAVQLAWSTNAPLNRRYKVFSAVARRGG